MKGSLSAVPLLIICLASRAEEPSNQPHRIPRIESVVPAISQPHGSSSAVIWYDDTVVTTGYNDSPNLKWLGNRPASQFKLHGDDGAGWWVCVEARAKLNTPGEREGINQLWIDGRLEAERTGLDWRGSFTDRGINAVFLEAYWNAGSPGRPIEVDRQFRGFDRTSWTDWSPWHQPFRTTPTLDTR